MERSVPVKFIRRVVSFSLLCVLAAHSQNPKAQNPAADQPTTVIKSQSRLVIVDVVARDLKGRLVVGLKPENFQVMENGVPQKISFFEDHTSVRTRPSGAKLQ